MYECTPVLAESKSHPHSHLEDLIAAPRTPQSPSLRESPLHLLRRSLQAYTAVWQSTVGDVTPPQYAVLLTVREQPDVDQSRLGRVTGIDLATLAPLVHRLEQRGLLTRRVDPANRRRKLLRLTEEGVRALERTGPLADEVDATALRGLTPEQRTALTDALRSISDVAGEPQDKT
ncbi:MarR family winged helix-turn-helix transcriptional regulator [Streptomyces sp. Ru73]|uniref:MarR family winged helix-turn-helix transcriptional regulator n=1 Tax=Streptomyces sp. Ru73 TaxID=2080748 RepID=UPI0015E2C6A2|nr:MarR family transcriptional regulator [Streptomyces sp. Ru73]